MAELDYSAIKQCTKCGEIKSLSEYNKDKTRKDGLFPQCRECIKADLKARYASNPKKYNDKAKANYQSNKEQYKERARLWGKSNPERKKQLSAEYRNKNRDKIKQISKRDWALHNEKRRAKKKQYRTENPERGAEHVRARQTRKQRAMPTWADRKAILDIYKKCRQLSIATGIPHHVDHYYPLKSDLVCGLHNEYNLRIIPAIENQSKGNSFPRSRT